MKLAEFTSVMRPLINEEMGVVLNDLIPEDFTNLREMMSYHLGWSGEGSGLESQGKRIRPILLLLTTSAAGGDWKKALPAAAAVEFLHNFSLLHDDIEDQSDYRHGRLTVWKKWGIPQAINTGDAMYTLAPLSILRLQNHYPANVCQQAMQLLMVACLKLTQGQYLDISFEKEMDIPVNLYWKMVEGKTASLLAACTKIGALLAGSTPEISDSFYKFGISLGLAFQAYDDILGIWGDPSHTGKSIESDLATGKKTLPVLFGLNNHGKFAQRWNKGPILIGDVAELAQTLEIEGAREYAVAEAERYTKSALQALSDASGSNEAASALRELADMLLLRNH